MLYSEITSDIHAELVATLTATQWRNQLGQFFPSKKQERNKIEKKMRWNGGIKRELT